MTQKQLVSFLSLIYLEDSYKFRNFDKTIPITWWEGKKEVLWGVRMCVYKKEIVHFLQGLVIHLSSVRDTSPDTPLSTRDSVNYVSRGTSLRMVREMVVFYIIDTYFGTGSDNW